MKRALSWLLASVAALAGCATEPPIPAVPHVDLDRFMGDWYVIASIPTRFERDAYNAVESYSLRPDGKIGTNFRYRKGGFDGELKTMHPIGTVEPGTGNAVWGMQFIWPIDAEYIIAYLDPDYETVIVARSKRDYVWIMARKPSIEQSRYAMLVRQVAGFGYAPQSLRRVPQRWPEEASPSM